ncbi:MAG: HypC/HybG/HupF family hydrogenase formation chaperone [Gemmatimonadales bacterium]|nr:HypC/HybG/HupF family hydrogenase formation chaperone [Gemmatimonadales bacterium]
MCLGIPGRIIEMKSELELPTGVVDFGGAKREVCLAYVADEVSTGDYVIVHAGVAISVVNEEEAQHSLELLRSLAQLDGREPADTDRRPAGRPEQVADQ